jgi:hypothetical protein
VQALTVVNSGVGPFQASIFGIWLPGLYDFSRDIYARLMIAQHFSFRLLAPLPFAPLEISEPQYGWIIETTLGYTLAG